jgi:hypothetical protein
MPHHVDGEAHVDEPGADQLLAIAVEAGEEGGLFLNARRASAGGFAARGGD